MKYSFFHIVPTVGSLKFVLPLFHSIFVFEWRKKNIYIYLKNK